MMPGMKEKSKRNNQALVISATSNSINENVSIIKCHVRLSTQLSVINLQERILLRGLKKVLLLMIKRVVFIFEGVKPPRILSQAVL